MCWVSQFNIFFQAVWETQIYLLSPPILLPNVRRRPCPRQSRHPLGTLSSGQPRGGRKIGGVPARLTFATQVYDLVQREEGDVGLFITLVLKFYYVVFLFIGFNNFY